MTEILCRWLNEELQLSRRVDPEIFAKEFSTGYLIGEILNKHQLQNDFDQFSQGRNAVSQLNNFQRLLPTLQLLGVMFSDIVVKALIAEQHGVATRLLYQIYIALRRKKSAKFPKLAMDTLGASKLASISAEMYKERLRSVIPREVDVVLRSDPHHPVVQGKSTEEVVIPQEEQKLQKRHSHQEEQQTQNEGPYTAKRKNKELKGKSKASIIPITMMPQGMTKTVQIRKQELRTKEAEMFLNEITKFEKILKDLTPEGGEERESSRLQPAAPPEESGAACVRGEQTRSFIENVRKRLTDDAKARKEREKRRRRVLLEQLEAHEAQEEVYREEQLVHRLMRQSLQERRITVQLMHARHEKQIMIQNRIYREKQYEEQRLKEFTDSLDREKMVVRQELLERAEERDQQRQVHEMLLAERAERRFRKHYALCLEVAEHIVDLATMVAEYSDLTFGLIPSKMMREWKELFFAQKPIYEQLATAQQLAGDSPEDIEMAKQQLHNAHDYEDYQCAGSKKDLQAFDSLHLHPVDIDSFEVEVRTPGISFCSFVDSGTERFTAKLAAGPEIRARTLGPGHWGRDTGAQALGTGHWGRGTGGGTLGPGHWGRDTGGRTLGTEHWGRGPDTEDRTLGAGHWGQGPDTGAGTLGTGPRHWGRDTGDRAPTLGPGHWGPDTGDETLGTGFSLASGLHCLLQHGVHIDGLEIQGCGGDETVLEKPPEMPPPAPAEAPPAQEAPKEGILAAQGSVSAGGATKEKNKASLRERKQSKAGSAAPPDSGKSSAKGTGKKAGESPGDRKQSKPGSTKGKKGKDQKGKLEAQALEPASQLDSGLPPPPKPGSDQWVYVDEPVPQEIAEYLARYWSDIVVIYTSTIHMVLQELRQERHRLIHNLHTLWRDFGEYLDTRPDHKQEFVSRWLEDFNSVNDDLRSDNDVKAELLLRLYNLRECLWDISDRRKEEAMRERQNLIGNGWLQDHLGIILNLYTTLMQVEVDRFQDSARFLQDYYKGMEGKIPLEHNKEFARIPLVDVADVEPPTFTDPEMGNIQLSDGQVTTENSSPTPQDKDQQESEQQKGQEMKSFSPPQMSDGQRKAEGSTPATRGEEQQGGEQEGAQETNPSRVPLVPYRIPSSSSSAVKDKGKAPLKAAARAKEEVQTVEALLHTSIDDYLIFEAHNTATSTLTNLIQREVKIKEDEERKEEKLKEEKEQQKSSAGKDSKKKSAGKKKGLHSTTPKLPVVVENPEEARRRELSERMFIEYLTALDSEAVAVTCRLDLIKLKALAVVQDLNAKADEVFATMEDWLGSQFLQEMDSIAALLAVGLEHIEDGTKIKYHLALGSKEFFVDGDVKLVEDPGPPPRQPSAETPKAGQMTVQQLRDLVQHFTGVSPTGLMMRRTFIETLHDLVSQDLGSDSLPEPWCNITYPQVVELARVLAADSDFLDWRQFVLPLAQPWPYPSLQELLQTKARFQALDQADSGYVTEQRYEQVELWFTGDEGIQVPDDPVEPIPFDRLRQLKQAFFSMFVVGSGADCRLDYNNMLLYFAAHRDPAQGLHRALSLTVGDPLPWTPIPTASPSQLEPVASLPVPEWRLSPDEGLPGAVSHKVPLSAVIQVSSHGPPAISDTHRHAGQDTETQQRCKRFAQVYKELGSKELEPVAFDILLKHPVIVDLITNTMRFSQPDIQAVVQRRLEPEGVANSSPDPSVEPSVSSPTDEPGRQSRRRIHKA
ncbi:LOW QUALITY PROTEIN: sperm flagellar protein 2 [Rhinoraja longicauda]